MGDVPALRAGDDDVGVDLASVRGDLPWRLGSTVVFEGQVPEAYTVAIEAVQALVLPGAGYGLRSDVAASSGAGSPSDTTVQ